ncbi:hypothetical protein GUJ93_ZPchr0007g3411 [Zizania palustris]|uniref:Uncharacterized protein n=1 Tax=Zizania palustris TaxID=103762 RepID=A0A8J5SRV8_ZIZPA|nr:hypothetical protein GUJ93_ZPchr0007g3411 [Zizania palustris]
MAPLDGATTQRWATGRVALSTGWLKTTGWRGTTGRRTGGEDGVGRRGDAGRRGGGPTTRMKQDDWAAGRRRGRRGITGRRPGSEAEGGDQSWGR